MDYGLPPYWITNPDGTRTERKTGENLSFMNSRCTFARSGRAAMEQEWATCYDCFATENEGACLSCLINCHKGHNVGKTKFTGFFCDCGAARCNPRLNHQHINEPPYPFPQTHEIKKMEPRRGDMGLPTYWVNNNDGTYTEKNFGEPDKIVRTPY